LTVGVGQDVRVELTLQPGEQTQTVTVTGDVPMVNTTSATLGGTVENATIVDLPLNGRAFQKLLDFNPGMQQIPGGGTPAYNVNGQRGTNTTWMLDGVDEINMAGGAEPTVGGNGGGVDGVTILSLDAIQKINTIQSPKAEYGWMAGSLVNVGLKSGTNNVHGTAFGFLRNGALDARNAFLEPTLSKATDNLKQYGVTIGGPIKKDKLFYFGAYEGNRYTIVSTVSALPAQCISASSASAVNPAVNTTGLQALASFGCYFQNGTAIAPAAQGTYGDMARDVLGGSPFRETNLSVTKSWKVRASMSLQFRAEFFNIFNAVEFSNPGQSTATANLAAPGSFGASSSTPNTFSFIFGSGGPRTAQLRLEFLF
jgi:hypothetical protein